MHRHPNGFVDIAAVLFGCPHETSEVLKVKRSYMYADLCCGQSHKECEAGSVSQKQLTTAPEHSTVPCGCRPCEAGSHAQGEEAGCSTAACRSRVVT